MLDTETTINLYKKGIRNGRLNKFIDPDYNYFTCGAFMKNICPSQVSTHNDCLLYSTQSPLNTKEKEWWVKKIEEFGIKAEYLGIEKGANVFRYIIEDSYSSVYRLLRFTILRYAWAKPYSKLVKKMYHIETEDKLNGYDFWKIFMLYHAVLSRDDYYDSTFGLTGPNTILNVDNKKMIELFTVNNTGKPQSSSINYLFSGEIILNDLIFGWSWSKSDEYVNKYLENEKK